MAAVSGTMPRATIETGTEICPRTQQRFAARGRRFLVKNKGKNMLSWALTFLIIALVAGVLGFGGMVAGTALWIAKVLFVVFLILFLVSLVTGRRAPV
jgi:uncharacterized membrane protein YtjA (UPF0391 family)